MKYEIISIDNLIPLEKVFPTHLKNLEEIIDNDGVVLKPIIADMENGIILDGSHRYVYFLKRGYKQVPVYWVDYEDESVRVGTKLKHRFLIDGDINISKEECKRRALTGNIFPPKTTRHFFTFRKLDISVPLNQLKKGKPVEVSHLIDDSEIGEEILHNEMYIKEIDEEIGVIVNYLSEVSETKKYLTDQVNLMKSNMKVAFFPGKFHPPHLGHLQTILNILPRYRKLIIGISEDMPKDIVVTEPDTILNVLKSFFSTFENLEFCKISGVLSKKKDLKGLPNFDVLLSGNVDVLNWAKKFNINAEYIARSEGFLFSGTEIRTVLGDKNE